MTAPGRSSQPSRKTKKAWRKNIDLEDVTSGLDSARDELRITGGAGLLADVPTDTLFQTDTAGDVGVQRKAIKEHGRLRVDEILAERSKIPSVSAKKRPGDERTTDGILVKRRKTGGGVSQKEYERLRQVAFGRNASTQITRRSDGEDDADGHIPDLHDPWAAPQTLEVVKTPTADDWIVPPPKKKAPATLRHAPIPLTVSGKAPSHVSKPSAGSSYNPSAPDWLSALDKAGADEVTAEKRRVALAAAEAEREARVAKAGEEAERDANALSDAVGMSEYESEWEGFQSEVDEAALKQKRPQRKTVAERNKVKRRKEKEALERHEKRMKARDEQERRIDEMRRELVKADGQHAKKMVAKIDSGHPTSDSDADSDHEAGVSLKKRRFGARQIPEAPLELVLPDELEDSLRRLKPEGNLLNERFRNMIVQGRVEARPKPVGQVRKKRVKSTEKWSHKDWTLQ